MSTTRRLVAALMTLAAIVAACSDEPSPSSNVPPAPAATLQILAGAVEVRSGSGDFATALDGQEVRQGDTVATGSDGRAVITYRDGSVTRLDEDTTFTLAALEVLDSGGIAVEGEQHSGNTYHRVVEITDSASRFDVITPTASASVQGTVYAVFVAADGSSIVAVIEGVVIVEGAVGGVLVVSAGFMATVNPDGSIGEVVPIPDEVVDGEWIVYNQCELDDDGTCAVTTTSTSSASDSTTTTTTAAGTTTSAASTTTTAPPRAVATALVLSGSSAQLDPVCSRTYRATFLDATGNAVDDDHILVTFSVVGGGGSVVFDGGPTAVASDGVAFKSVSGGENGVVRLQASGGGLSSNVIEFNVVPPGGCG